MASSAARELDHFNQNQDIESHDQDLVQELNKRLEALWRHKHYVAHASGNTELQKLWCDFKRQEQEKVCRVQLSIAEEILEYSCEPVNSPPVIGSGGKL